MPSLSKPLNDKRVPTELDRCCRPSPAEYADIVYLKPQPVFFLFLITNYSAKKAGGAPIWNLKNAKENNLKEK